MTESDNFQTRAMRFGRDSVLQFVPDRGWTVEFTQQERTWTLPAIGWAVRVRWTDYLSGRDAAERDEGGANVETGLDPVVLNDDGQPLTVTEYVDDVVERKGTNWRVVAAH